MSHRRGDPELASVMRKLLTEGGVELVQRIDGTEFLGLDYSTIDLTEDEAQAIEEAQRGE